MPYTVIKLIYMSISVSCMHLETAKENNRPTQVLLSAGIFRYFKIVKFIWGEFYSLIANYRFKNARYKIQ